jgi:uncharacterized protein DUF454
VTAQAHDGGHTVGGKPPDGRRRRRRPRRKRRSKAWNLALAIFFFILGIIGVLLPIVPQIPFFVMSLLFFSFVFPAVRRALRRFLHRHPKIAHAYKKWRDKGRRKRLEMIRREREFFGSDVRR